MSRELVDAGSEHIQGVPDVLAEADGRGFARSRAYDRERKAVRAILANAVPVCRNRMHRRS
jgi:hypothetical protein